jgi:hypothetical protein
MHLPLRASTLRPILSTLAGVAALAALPASASAAGGTFGYVWASQPTASSYTPERAWQANSAGLVNTIVRTGTGNYVVTFPGVARSRNAGTVNVTAYGDLRTTYCNNAGWGPNGTGGVDVVVLCTDTNGNAADAQFNVTYAVPQAKGKLGYVWADQPTAGYYTPNTYAQFNTTGGVNTVNRVGTGSYIVRLPGLGAAGGTVKVTSFGAIPNRCKVAWWGPDGLDQRVGVYCYSATGLPADSLFTMTYANARNLLGSGSDYGYAWADKPATPSYTPAAASAKSKPGGPIVITRTATGRYLVEFNGLGSGVVSDVQVTSYGGGASECRVIKWLGNGVGQAATVTCYEGDGTPADAYFTIQYIR